MKGKEVLTSRRPAPCFSATSLLLSSHFLLRVHLLSHLSSPAPSPPATSISPSPSHFITKQPNPFPIKVELGNSIKLVPY